MPSIMNRLLAPFKMVFELPPILAFSASVIKRGYTVEDVRRYTDSEEFHRDLDRHKAASRKPRESIKLILNERFPVRAGATG